MRSVPSHSTSGSSRSAVMASTRLPGARSSPSRGRSREPLEETLVSDGHEKRAALAGEKRQDPPGGQAGHGIEARRLGATESGQPPRRADPDDTGRVPGESGDFGPGQGAVGMELGHRSIVGGPLENRVGRALQHRAAREGEQSGDVAPQRLALGLQGMKGEVRAQARHPPRGGREEGAGFVERERRHRGSGKPGKGIEDLPVTPVVAADPSGVGAHPEVAQPVLEHRPDLRLRQPVAEIVVADGRTSRLGRGGEESRHEHEEDRTRRASSPCPLHWRRTRDRNAPRQTEATRVSLVVSVTSF